MSETAQVEKPEIEEEEIEVKTEETPEVEETETEVEEKQTEEAEPEVNWDIPNVKMTLERDLLKTILKAVDSITDEPIFKVKEDGIHLRQMDVSNVAMLDFQVDISQMEEYQCDKEGVLCFKIDDMKGIAGGAYKDDLVTIESNEDSEFIEVTIKGDYTKDYAIPHIETVEDTAPIPEVDLQVDIETSVDNLKRVIGDVGLVSEHIKIIARGEEVVFQGKGSLSNAEVTWRREGQQLLGFSSEEDKTEAVYSISYLSNIIKALPDGDSTISYASDLPMKIDLNDDIGELTFFLAPRIDME